MVLAVNKMDLVDYAGAGLRRASPRSSPAYAAELGVPEITAIPISALAGDNVVDPSAHMDWYGGPTVLEHLETVPVSHDPARLTTPGFPVQYVIRPQTAEHPDYRGYAGQIASGALRVGERGDGAALRPYDHASTGIDLLGEPVDVAWAPQSVTLLLADDLDISRGDLIVPGKRRARRPRRTSRRPSATSPTSRSTVGHRVLLKHTTRTVKAIVKDIPSRLTLDDLSQHPHPGSWSPTTSAA